MFVLLQVLGAIAIRAGAETIGTILASEGAEEP